MSSQLATSQQPGQRGSEPHSTGAVAEVHRLDAQPVPEQYRASGVLFVNADGEHADQTVDEVVPPRLVGLADNLGVARGEEPVPGGLQFRAQLLVVVDASVEHNGYAQGGIDHGLCSGLGQVDDLQSAVRQRDLLV